MAKKRGYFDLSDAVDDVSNSFGAKETALSGAKLVGKGLFNIARFAVTTGVDAFLSSASDKVLSSDKSTDEQRARAEDIRQRAQSRMQERERLDREWDEKNKQS